MGKVRLACVVVLASGVAACSVKRVTFIDDAATDGPGGGDPEDARGVDGPALDGPLPVPDAAGPALGTQENPARTCGELLVAGMPSAVYWLGDPTGVDRAFEVYCEQQLRGGGWAMLQNSVRRDDGTTTAFWQFGKADRLSERGTLSPDQNYYHGALYLSGTEYMDLIVDLQDRAAVAAVMTADRIDPETMRFHAPTFVDGVMEAYERHFASGWSSHDHDDDSDPGDNCATFYSNVAQHYGACWVYSLGSDAGEEPFFDGGVGPHVDNRMLLVPLGLALQPGGGSYSQVKRIARFTRW